jgi:hypothetical protein
MIERPSWLSSEDWPWDISCLTTSTGSVAFTDVGAGPVLLLTHVGFWGFICRDLIRTLIDGFRSRSLPHRAGARSKRVVMSFRLSASSSPGSS